MGRCIYFLLFSFSLLSVLSGQRHDYVWTLGYGNNPLDTAMGGTNIDFSTSPPTIEKDVRNTFFFSNNASYSDRYGKLLYYTNGCHIYGADGEIIQNGDNINYNSYHGGSCHHGYDLSNAVMFIPLPGNDQIVYLFHLTKSIGSEFEENIAVTHLRCSIIDNSLNDGKGGVVVKDSIIIEDLLRFGYLTATRHANGRDWWILMQRAESNLFHTILFTPKGLDSIFTQEVGEPPEHVSLLGEAVFSPDGSLYASFELAGDIFIYDFDRCQGVLSEFRRIKPAIPSDSLRAGGGLAISSNSRNLYATTGYHLIQYDLRSTDVSATMTVVGRYDGFRSPLSTKFYLLELAPNGKIYSSTTNTNSVLHVIHNPNKRGLECDLEQHGVQLLTYHDASMPNFPNYRLGAMTGSPCDTLGLGENPGQASVYRIYPNPFVHDIHIERLSGDQVYSQISIFDALGRLMIELPLRAGSVHTVIPGKYLLSGSYFYQIRRENGEVLQDGKLLKY